MQVEDWYAQMPFKLQIIDRAVKKLPNWEQKCVTLWFCAPLKDDGNLWTKREMARKLQISKYNFERHLKSGVRHLERLLA